MNDDLSFHVFKSISLAHNVLFRFLHFQGSTSFIYSYVSFFRYVAKKIAKPVPRVPQLHWQGMFRTKNSDLFLAFSIREETPVLTVLLLRSGSAFLISFLPVDCLALSRSRVNTPSTCSMETQKNARIRTSSKINNRFFFNKYVLRQRTPLSLRKMSCLRDYACLSVEESGNPRTTNHLRWSSEHTE